MVTTVMSRLSHRWQRVALMEAIAHSDRSTSLRKAPQFEQILMGENR